MRTLFMTNLIVLVMLMTACQPLTPTNTPTPFVSSTLTPAHTFRLTPADPSKANLSWLDEARITLQSRLAAELTSMVTVRVESSQLVVEVANDADVEIARQILGQPHLTIFFAADSPYAEGDPVPPGEMALMSGNNIIAAHAEPLPSGAWQVSVQLTSLGGRIVDTFAAVNTGRFLMIAQDGRVIRSLVIRWHDAKTTAGLYVFDTQVNIRGELTESSAKTLATQLNGSQLPLEMNLSETK